MAEQRSSSGNFNNRWKFNGKELDEEIDEGDSSNTAKKINA
jgi:hypothetical protein